MGPLRLLIGLVAVSACLADSPLDTLLKGIESRYNQAKTLQVLFKEEYAPIGRPRQTESGILMLRKPGRMRWDYSQPKGKLFIGDGKYLWIYTPEEKKAEKMSMKETADMRAPLAFLLGKLNFQKEFRNLKTTPEGNATRITAEPKGDNLPYSQVEFLVTSDGTIHELKVLNFDKSTMEFKFDQERLDPKLDTALFQFKAPPGTAIVEDKQ